MADEIEVLDETDILTLIDIHLDNEEITVVPLGPPGIVPLVASFNTVSILSQTVVTQGPNLVIDRALAEYVILILQNDITSFTVLNWPPPPYLGRIHLDIYNQGSFTMSWPPGCTTPYGISPQLTTKGNDFIILTTVNGGANIKISIVSPSYQPLQ